MSISYSRYDSTPGLRIFSTTKPFRSGTCTLYATASGPAGAVPSGDSVLRNFISLYVENDTYNLLQTRRGITSVSLKELPPAKQRLLPSREMTQAFGPQLDLSSCIVEFDEAVMLPTHQQRIYVDTTFEL